MSEAAPDFEALRAERNRQVDQLRQQLADGAGVPLQSVICTVDPHACYCACSTDGPCEHNWGGWQEWETDDGRFGSRVCSRCGTTAMDHDVHFFP